jgi:DNA-binding NarL/FixJ family response regulator
LIVDPDAEYRALVVTSLGRAGYATLEAETGEEALAAVRRERPGLILVEIDLHDMIGYELCRELREDHGDELPVFLMSEKRTDPTDRVAGLLLGADDFIVKPFDPGELLARVRRFVARPVSGERASQPQEGQAGLLTRREQEVLQLLADGLRQKEIARRLSLSPRTVAAHIQRMLEKFGVHSRAELVALAYRDRLLEASSPSASAPVAGTSVDVGGSGSID